MSCTEDCSIIMELNNMDPLEIIFSIVTESFDKCHRSFFHSGFPLLKLSYFIWIKKLR